MDLEVLVVVARVSPALLVFGGAAALTPHKSRYPAARQKGRYPIGSRPILTFQNSSALFAVRSPLYFAHFSFIYILTLCFWFLVHLLSNFLSTAGLLELIS